jgi:hypothetical protein
VLSSKDVLKSMNERLQKLQEEQAKRKEDLEKGRIRIERPSPARAPKESQDKTAS